LEPRVAWDDFIDGKDAGDGKPTVQGAADVGLGRLKLSGRREELEAIDGLLKWFRDASFDWLKPVEASVGWLGNAPRVGSPKVFADSVSLAVGLVTRDPAKDWSAASADPAE
jgi:hypothetical protein